MLQVMALQKSLNQEEFSVCRVVGSHALDAGVELLELKDTDILHFRNSGDILDQTKGSGEGGTLMQMCTFFWVQLRFQLIDDDAVYHV